VLPYVPKLGTADYDDYGDSEYEDLYDNYPAMYREYSEERPVYAQVPVNSDLQDSGRPSVDEDTDLYFEMAELQLPTESESAVQRSLMVDAPGNKIIYLDSKEEEEKNSADFDSFETIHNPRADIKVRNVQDVIVRPADIGENKPLLLSVGSSLSYGKDGEKHNKKSRVIASVGDPEYLLNSPPGNVQSPKKSHQVVYGKATGTPPAPLDVINTVDSSLTNKLKLLQHSPGNKGESLMADLVEDIWSNIHTN